MISIPPGTEMFQFPGLAPLRVTDLAASRVAPFGHPEITAYVQLPQAFRSLPRPSSPLDAKAFTVCLILFDPTILRSELPAMATHDRNISVDSGRHVQARDDGFTQSFNCQRADTAGVNRLASKRAG